MNPMRMGMLAALMVPGAGHLHADSAGWLAERVARVFSPEMRRTEAQLGEVAGELAGLPELLPAPFASRYGYRSATLFDQELPQWVQIDLGRSQPIDRIVAVPAHIPGIGTRGEGYGFPLRFKIQVADDPGMEGAVPFALTFTPNRSWPKLAVKFKLNSALVSAPKLKVVTK
jgi:hypothetical protein